ncbi:MAG: hypothetical protein SWY16_09905 [Cyanobacteriota bacterium]|nr:hypothetical protein [Cyanobacteriota bacterium]
MSATDRKDSKSNTPNPSSVVLGLATAPILAGLWGSQMLMAWMREVGQVSEEILRGDRLPILNFPETVSGENDE